MVKTAPRIQNRLFTSDVAMHTKMCSIAAFVTMSVVDDGAVVSFECAFDAELIL